VVLVGSKWFLVVLGGSWGFLVFLGGSWLFLVVLSDFCLGKAFKKSSNL